MATKPILPNEELLLPRPAGLSFELFPPPASSTLSSSPSHFPPSSSSVLKETDDEMEQKGDEVEDHEMDLPTKLVEQDSVTGNTMVVIAVDYAHKEDPIHPNQETTSAFSSSTSSAESVSYTHLRAHET